jgi:translation initiation factor IF-3
MIRVFELRIVDEDGSQLGVMRTQDALRLAQERGLDLVEVAPLASPPVARLLDFGQYKYELTKREKEAKRKQRSITFKEVRLKPKIGVGDFDTKVRRAIEFLEDGDRVKIAVQFRGRELTHPQIGRDLLDKFAEQIKEHGVVERPPLLEGKSMHISVASTHKPKPVEAPPASPVKGQSKGDTAEATTPAEGDETNGKPATGARASAEDKETNGMPPAPPVAPGPEPETGSASTGV